MKVEKLPQTREKPPNIDPAEVRKAKLRILYQELFNLLKGPTSQAKINFLGDTPFCEKVYSDRNCRISTSTPNFGEDPTQDSTFVIIIGGFKAPQNLVLVPPNPDFNNPLEVKISDLTLVNKEFGKSYIPTNPTKIAEILNKKGVCPKPIPDSLLSQLLRHFLRL